MRAKIFLKTIAFIRRENMLGYLTADSICSEKGTVFRKRSRAKLEENCELRGQISEHIFKVKWRLLCLLSFKYFSQHPRSVYWPPKSRLSIHFETCSTSWRTMRWRPLKKSDPWPALETKASCFS